MIEPQTHNTHKSQYKILPNIPIYQAHFGSLHPPLFPDFAVQKRGGRRIYWPLECTTVDSAGLLAPDIPLFLFIAHAISGRHIAETRSSASVTFFCFQPNWSWPILKLPLSPFFLPLVPFFLHRLLSLPSLCSFYFTVYPTREFIGSIKNIRLIFWKSLVCILKTVVW